MPLDDAIKVAKVGVTVATVVGSTNTAIPTDSSGSAPRYIRVAAIAAAYVKVGKGAQTATANDILVQPADAVILNVTGMDNIATIRDSIDTKVNVVCIENG